MTIVAFVCDQADLLTVECRRVLCKALVTTLSVNVKNAGICALSCVAVSVADPDPGSGAFLTPGSGMGRKSASGLGIRDEQPGSYFLELINHFFGFFGVKILKFFDADPGSGMKTVRIRDPGWKKVESGIRDKHPGSATLSAGICALSCDAVQVCGGGDCWT
jgi:hypothetical protein